MLTQPPSIDAIQVIGIFLPVVLMLAAILFCFYLEVFNG